MRLRYTTPGGEEKIIELTEKAITIGRNPEVDVAIDDKMISRIHCGISFWDNAFFLRDFKSNNGTFLNDREVSVARINPGDSIRLGDTVLAVEDEAPGTSNSTVIREVKQKMDSGKGYHTILQEIIAEEKKK